MVGTEEDGCKWEYFFDQGESLQCTLFAIARSICNATRRDGYLVLFKDIMEKLTCLRVYQSGWYKGWYPTEFNDELLAVVPFRNMKGEDIGFRDISIKVEEDTLDTNPYIRDEEFVLVDRRDPQDHCMAVICTINGFGDGVDDESYFLCRDNKDTGEKSKRYSRIPTSKSGNTMYKVTISTMIGMMDESHEDMTPLSPDESNVDIWLQEESANFDFQPQWAASYDPTRSRTLQSISLAISECCKETLSSFISPDIIRANIIGLYKYNNDGNVMEKSPDPIEFNNTIMTLNSEQIEVKVASDQPRFYVFDKEYVYKPRQGNNLATSSRGLRCYYVICKSKKDETDYFVCRDPSKIFGPKMRILPEVSVDDEAYSLYKVQVKQPDISDIEGWREMEEMDFY